MLLATCDLARRAHTPIAPLDGLPFLAAAGVIRAIMDAMRAITKRDWDTLLALLGQVEQSMSHVATNCLWIMFERSEDEGFLCEPGRTSPHISPHLPTSPHISPHLLSSTPPLFHTSSLPRFFSSTPPLFHTPSLPHPLSSTPAAQLVFRCALTPDFFFHRFRPYISTWTALFEGQYESTERLQELQEELQASPLPCPPLP